MAAYSQLQCNRKIKESLLPYTYPATNHRLLTGDGGRSYDANGNTTARGSESLFYGDHNRLVSWSSAFGMSNASYQHNARGERVMKTSLIGQMSLIGEEVPPNCLPVEGQSVQTFLYDESGRLIRDTSDPCAARPTNFEFVWLDNQPLAVIDADPALPAPIVVGHISADHLHTPRAISNASGTVTWTWAPVSGNSTSGGSNVFGDRPAQATGAPFNTRAFNLRLPGQYLDAESRLHYNYFRDYEPGTGRYVQSDPIGLDGGLSTYGYVDGNPVGWADPYGLSKNKLVQRWARCSAQDEAQCREICAPRNMESCRRKWILGTGIGADGQPYKGWIPKGLSCSCEETFCERNTTTCAVGVALGATALFLGRAAAACAIAVVAN